MRHLLLIALGLALVPLAGCSCDDRPPPSRLVPQHRVSAGSPDAGIEPGPARTPPSIQPGQPTAAAPAEAPSDAGSERDLDAELRQAFGDPSACLTWSEDAPDSISINASVTIARMGMVTRSTVSGSWLDHRSRRCLEGMANRVRFDSPVPGAPTNASTSFTIENRRPAAPVAAPSFEQQTGGDVVVLEAVPGRPISGPAGDPIEGPAGDPISGPAGDTIDGPAGVPIEANPGIPIGQE